MNKSKKNLKKYNPYTYLVLDNEYYEEEVIAYYNNYKEIYGDSSAFFKRMVECNDEAVKWAIADFLDSKDDIKTSVNDLKRKIRGIKNIVLLTENGNNTKKHIDSIDRKVDAAIDYKNENNGTLDQQFNELYYLFNEFNNNPFDRALVNLKQKVKELVESYNELYSLKMSVKITKKIYNMMDKVINDRSKYMYVYTYYDIEIRDLLEKYKNKVIDNEDSYIDWVNGLRDDYNQIKFKIRDIYSKDIYSKYIKIYDKEIDKLIDYMMYRNGHFIINDDKELEKMFTYYEDTIGKYNFDEYYAYMTDSEKFNVKREMYEEKNRQFKRDVRNFNKKIRNKYSSSYANAYVNKVNKKADTIIKKNAKNVGMPVPKNPWMIRKYLWADTENFVSDEGIKVRKLINPVLRKIVRLAMENKLIIEEMPKLNSNKQYIFVSTHYFTEDVIGLFTATDRQAYMLMGTTDQIENNPLMLAAMAFGFFHVDRLDKEDRKECFEKQNILIDKGTSFINYIGGGWENSENELQPPSFSGAYRTSKLKDVLIVPVASYLVREDKKVYMRFGEPLDVRNYDENIANDIIRDTLASMHYKQISKYSYPITDSKLVINNKVVSTHKLPYDQHKYYMDQIGDEYWHQPWTKPFAKEEIGPRKRKITSLEEVYGFIDNLSREKLIELSSLLSPEMVRIDEKERYNISKYLDANYEKFKVRGLKKK